MIKQNRRKKKKIPKPPLRAEVGSGESSSGKSILVVEDSKTSRKVISMLLSRKGHTIIEATTGQEALSRISEKNPDLVLLDVMLPDMTGYEILPLIKKEVATVPVVMLTGKKSSTDRLKGMKSGASEYLTKPFDPAKLLAVVDRYLDIKTTEKHKDKKGHSRERKSAVPRQLRAVTAARVKRAEKILPAAMEKKAGKDRKTILVVEDSPTSRKVISMVLSKKGYGVEEAVDGSEALEKVAASLPDLILLDAMLPDITGYELLPKLQPGMDGKEIPVVMLTGKKGSVDRERGMRAGSVAYLTKPFNPENLLTVIGRYVG
jgi:CheY-like chemotaxis protein